MTWRYLPKKPCAFEGCRKDFQPSAPWALYCSTDCKYRASRRPPAPRRLVVLPPGAFPTFCEPARSEDDVRRRLHCLHYSACLTYTDEKQAENFHCGNCPIEETISVEQLWADVERHLALEEAAANYENAAASRAEALLAGRRQRRHIYRA